MIPVSIPSAPALVSVDGLGGLVRLAMVVIVCAGLAAVINRWGRLGHGRDDLTAALRACLQLSVVGLLILAVLRSWWLTLGFITLMLSVASVTAGRRLTRKGQWWLAFAPVVLGAVPVAGGLMLSGLIPPRDHCRRADRRHPDRWSHDGDNAGRQTLPGCPADSPW